MTYYLFGKNIICPHCTMMRPDIKDFVFVKKEHLKKEDLYNVISLKDLNHVNDPDEIYMMHENDVANHPNKDKLTQRMFISRNINERMKDIINRRREMKRFINE